MSREFMMYIEAPGEPPVSVKVSEEFITYVKQHSGFYSELKPEDDEDTDENDVLINIFEHLVIKYGYVDESYAIETATETETLDDLERHIEVFHYLRMPLNANAQNNLAKFMLRGEFVSIEDVYYNVPRKYRAILHLYRPETCIRMFKESPKIYKEHVCIYSMSEIVMRKAMSMNYVFPSLADYIGSVECFNYGRNNIVEDNTGPLPWGTRIKFIPDLEVFKRIVPAGFEYSSFFDDSLLPNLVLYGEEDTAVYICKGGENEKLYDEDDIEGKIDDDNVAIFRIFEQIKYEPKIGRLLCRVIELKLYKMLEYIKFTYATDITVETLSNYVKFSKLHVDMFTYVYLEELGRSADDEHLAITRRAFFKCVTDDANNDILDYIELRYRNLLSSPNDFNYDVVKYGKITELKGFCKAYRMKMKIIISAIDNNRSEFLKYINNEIFTERITTDRYDSASGKYVTKTIHTQINKVGMIGVEVVNDSLGDGNISIATLAELFKFKISTDIDTLKLTIRRNDPKLLEQLLIISPQFRDIDEEDIKIAIYSGRLKSVILLCDIYAGILGKDSYNMAVKYPDILEYLFERAETSRITRDLITSSNDDICPYWMRDWSNIPSGSKTVIQRYLPENEYVLECLRKDNE